MPGPGPELTLAPAFFARDTASVASDLVGCHVLVDPGTPLAVRARIVETEAYLGERDPASHAFRGPTQRARIMFGEPGRLYVYLSYGMHHCANLVTEPEATAGAVLLRAAEVLSGEGVVRERRGAGPDPADLLRGPGNLCRGLGIVLADNGIDVTGTQPSRMTLLRGDRPAAVDSGPRMGISRATELPLRFLWRGHAAVSGTRKGPVRAGP